MSSCTSCGSPIPDGQGSSCSMCYGDMSYGSDGYYEAWAAEEMRQEELKEEEIRQYQEELQREESIVMVIQEKGHWFCLSYQGKRIESGLDCQASIYIGLENRNITKKDIDDNKKLANVTDKAVLMAASYLGYMTREEFEG